MEWLGFSFLTALFEASKDVLGKKSLEKYDEYAVSWALRIYALPFLLPLLFFAGPLKLGPGFWWALLVGGGLNVITTILYMKAIKASDLSVTVPMVTFTPLFLLVTAPVIVGEFPSPRGIAGIVLIVCGSYLLNLKERKKGIWAPFKAILKEKGPRLMLVVAFIWSITSPVDKVGILNSSVFHWVVAVHLFSVVAMVPVVAWFSRGKAAQVWKRPGVLVPLGLINGLKSICQMAAIRLALVAYVISIKRTSAVLAVIMGVLIFKESGFRERLVGVIIMVLGVVLITLP